MDTGPSLERDCTFPQPSRGGLAYFDKNESRIDKHVKAPATTLPTHREGDAKPYRRAPSETQ